MSIRTFFGGAPFLAFLIGGLTALAAETSVVPEPGDLRTAGTVDFPVSCAPAARPEFIRGVALLHSFLDRLKGPAAAGYFLRSSCPSDAFRWASEKYGFKYESLGVFEQRGP